jgi:clan AA aspartic protease (TIGR02281 family)
MYLSNSERPGRRGDRLQSEPMSEAILEEEEATRLPSGAKRSPAPVARPGRTLAMALGAAAVMMVVSLAISGAVISHAPPPAAGKAAAAHGDTTLFYQASHEQSLRRSSDGQIYVNAEVNEHPLRFRIDATESKLLLSPSAARAAGLAEGPLTYSGRATTAAGEVRTAPVTIQYLHFNTLTLFNVPAAVADTSLPESILGMEFLKRFQGYQLLDDKLVLRW